MASEHKPQNQTKPHGTVDVGGNSDTTPCAMCGKEVGYMGDWSGVKGNYVRAKDGKMTELGTVGLLFCASCWEKAVARIKHKVITTPLSGKAS